MPEPSSILGKPKGGIDWTLAIIAGLVGSFIGGLLISLISGDGIDFHISGIIGSIVGALIVRRGLGSCGCVSALPDRQDAFGFCASGAHTP